jgi:hypothetical protein
MGASPAVAQLKSVQGILSGVVRDAAGTPQMGASVEVIPELAAASAPLGFFTNTQGIFRGERLAPGFYTVRVTLAGFLPTLEKHIRVSANLTTLVRIQMESMFSSLGVAARPFCRRLRRWTIGVVLRTASSVRPVLQWVEEDSSERSQCGLESRSHGTGARPPGITDGAQQTWFGFEPFLPAQLPRLPTISQADKTSRLSLPVHKL